MRRSRRPRGMSLVEVLVVLVVLVIGIAALLVLFPHGFFSLNYSAEKTLAISMAKDNENWLRNQRENLPDAVVGWDPVAGTIRNNLQEPDFLHSGSSSGDPRISDANLARRVIGEQCRIPPPTLGFAPRGGFPQGETVSLYRALFSPIYAVDAALPATAGVVVYSGTPAQRVVFQDPPSAENWQAVNQLGVQGYGVNYELNKLYFEAAPFDRVFKIEYTYGDATGVGEAPPDTQFLVRAGDTEVTMPVAAGVVDLGSDHLYRVMRRVPVADPFTADPYEYKVYDTTLGLFGFHPVLSTLPMSTLEGRGLSARIDYDVDDWHIVRQDLTVPLDPVERPANAQSTRPLMHPLKLVTTGIKKIGDVEEAANFSPANPQGTLEYLGLVHYYPDTPARPWTPGVDLVVVDLETGYQIDSRTLQKGGNNSNGEIDYDAGVVFLRHLPQNGAAPMWSPPGSMEGAARYMSPAGRKVRIYYRTYHDLGVATSRPYTRYHRHGDLPTMRHRQYFAAPDNAFPAPNARGVVLFALADIGKTLAVDYTWRDANGTIHREIGELQQVGSPNDVGAPPLPGYGWIRLARTTEASLDPNPGALQVSGVRGVSLHTRVVWRDAKRWRHITRTTVLTREQTR